MKSILDNTRTTAQSMYSMHREGKKIFFLGAQLEDKYFLQTNG
jgi:hypothetical protein